MCNFCEKTKSLGNKCHDLTCSSLPQKVVYNFTEIESNFLMAFWYY